MTPDYPSKFFRDPVYTHEPNPRTAADIIAEEFMLIGPGITSLQEIYLAAERAEIALRAAGSLREEVERGPNPDSPTDAEARAAADVLIRKGWITIS